MQSGDAALVLRIYTGESDRWHGHGLHEALVLEAKRQGLAGATVLRGQMGFGAQSRIHTAHLVDISPDLPVVIEIVDLETKILAFLAQIEPMLQGGLVTTAPASVRIYRGHTERH